MLHHGDSVLVGVSGGPDSVALLDMLATMRRRKEMRIRLCAGHLHHGMRGADADEDEALVRETAKRWGVQFIARHVDVPALAEKRRVGVEHAGRRARYDQAACQEVGANKVALGHHADDVAETVLHRIMRGTGIRGLAGIPRVRPLSPGSPILVIRPLIDLARRDIIAYLSERGLESRFDATNASRDYLRNRIRMDVIPMLEATYNADIRRALARLARTAWDVDCFVTETAQAALARSGLCEEPGELRVSAAWLAGLPRAVAAEAAREILARLSAHADRFGREHVEALVALAGAEESGRALTLPVGLRAERQGGDIVLREGPRLEESVAAEPTPVQVPGETPLAAFDGSMRATIVDGGVEELAEFRGNKTRLEEMFDQEKVRLPLAVRPRRPGDRFHPLGGPGAQKIQDFMTDHKIRRPDRPRIPIVTMQDEPVWVVGWRMDERVKVREDTRRILHLRFTPSIRE